jgi:hypothetical protein
MWTYFRELGFSLGSRADHSGTGWRMKDKKLVPDLSYLPNFLAREFSVS